MLCCLAVNPSLYIDKVSDKAWDVTLEEDIISKQDVLAVDLTLVIVADNWKEYRGELLCLLSPVRK
jgi:hypothetical protein